MVELLLWLHLTQGGVLEIRTCTCRTKDLHRTSLTIMMPRAVALGLMTTVRTAVMLWLKKWRDTYRIVSHRGVWRVCRWRVACVVGACGDSQRPSAREPVVQHACALVMWDRAVALVVHAL